MFSSDLEFPESPPQSEVWNYLYSGLDLAQMEFDNLGEKEKEALESFAELVFARRSKLVGSPEDQEIYGDEEKLLKHPWFKHAVDLRFAGEVVERGVGMLRRYLQLRPILTHFELSERCKVYLGDAVQTFLFGFDAACVAFCGATLEQILKEALIRSKECTEQQIKQERLSGLGLLMKANEKKLITESYDGARKVLTQRNVVMHQGVCDKNLIRNHALENIAALGSTLQELGRVLTTH
jgi:hypothetical protein